MASTVHLELTPGEVAAIRRALDYWLVSSSEEEARQLFRSAAGVRAAERASAKLDRAH